MLRVKRKTVVNFVRFIVVLLICILMAIGLRERWEQKIASRHPRQTLEFVIDPEQREILFEQMRRFAQDHDFDIHIGPTTPANETFSIYMSRKDLIVWGDNVLNPRGYDFAVYDQNPNNPVPETVIDDVMNDLKTYVKEVPNVRIFD